MLVTHEDVARILWISSDWCATAVKTILTEESGANPRDALRRLAPLARGGRGTHIGKALQEVAAQNKKRAREGLERIPLCVVMTDGEISWPPRAAFLKTDVIVVLVPSWNNPKVHPSLEKQTRDAVGKWAKIIVAGY